MVVLGLWQMQVFTDQANKSAEQRASQAPVDLLSNLSASGEVSGDILGKQVQVSGTYLADQQVLVQGADGIVRVLTALLLEDGRVLAVVRGTLPADLDAAPPPPPGVAELTGVFLPSEADSVHGVPDGRLGSVRLPALAQLWPQRVLPGFVTLGPAASQNQRLGAAAVTLPGEEGPLRNAGYALQWWAFAVFAVVLGRVISKSLRGAAAVQDAGAPVGDG